MIIAKAHDTGLSLKVRVLLEHASERQAEHEYRQERLELPPLRQGHQAEEQKEEQFDFRLDHLGRIALEQGRNDAPGQYDYDGRDAERDERADTTIARKRWTKPAPCTMLVTKVDAIRTFPNAVPANPVLYEHRVDHGHGGSLTASTLR